MNAEPNGIPPYLDQFGREVWDNPWGQYRPNPRHGGTTKPAVRSATGLPVIPKATAEQEPAPAPKPTTEAAPEPTPAQAVQPYTSAIDDLLPATHRVAGGRITADDERLRSTIQYAKAYAKKCKAFGIEIPEEMRERLEHHTAQRRGRVHRRVRRGVAVATAVGGSFVGITAAQAMWSAHGSGSASAKATSLQNLTFANATASGTALLPGGPSGDLTIKVTNPNHFALKITHITQNGPVTNDKTGAGCTNDTGTPGNVTPGNSKVSVADHAVTGVTVAANASAASVAVPGVVSMAADSNNSCQGATFTVPVTITVQQQ